MSSSRSFYSSAEKRRVVSLYNRSKGRKSLGDVARECNISGGRRLVRKWVILFNNKKNKEKERKGPGRPRILTTNEAYNLIKRQTERSNEQMSPINNRQLLSTIESTTGHHPSLRTVERYSKEFGSKTKRTITRTKSEGNLYTFIRISF
jgi:transposase-like protein